jgi:hypothetical protein
VSGELLRDRRREERVRENDLVRSLTGILTGPFGYRCECGDERCHELLVVGGDDLLRIRSNRDWLLVAAGHESGDDLVDRTNGCSIVRAAPPAATA